MNFKENCLKANIGIAMGVNGSDIARRAADMWVNESVYIFIKNYFW